MSDYEVISLLLAFDNSALERGNYLVAGMIGFSVAVFYAGQKMTRLMTIILTLVYSVYAFVLTVGIFMNYKEASLIAASADASSLMQSPMSYFLDADGYLLRGIIHVAIILFLYALSILFLVLHRKQLALRSDA